MNKYIYIYIVKQVLELSSKYKSRSCGMIANEENSKQETK